MGCVGCVEGSEGTNNTARGVHWVVSVLSSSVIRRRGGGGAQRYTLVAGFPEGEMHMKSLVAWNREIRRENLARDLETSPESRCGAPD